MGQGAVFSRGFVSLFVSATDQELEPIGRALRGCDDAYGSDEVVRHCAGRLSECAARIGMAAEKIGREQGATVGCDDPQSGLAAAALLRAGASLPRRTTLIELEQRVIDVLGGKQGLEPAQQLAIAVARLRRRRLDRAAYWGLDVPVEKVEIPMSEGKDSASFYDILKIVIERLAQYMPLELLEQELAKGKKLIGKVNILIAGQTGVGKSSLINAIFGEDIAKVGFGRPVTTNIEWFSPPDLPVQLCDTRGLELKDFAETLAALEREIAVRSEKGDPAERVHILWLCISGRQTRVQQGAEGGVLDLCGKYGIPGVVVITQSTDRMSERLEAEAKAILPTAKAFVRVLAHRWDDSDPPVSPHGLQTLVEVTSALIPEAVRDAFIAAQLVDLEKKRKEAFGIAQTGGITAAVAAALPVPGASEAAVMAAIVTMIVRIALSMGVRVSRDNLIPLVSAMIASLLATLVIRLGVGEGLKLFLGPGSVAGGLINSGIAGAAAYGLGYGFIEYLTEFLIEHHRMPTGEELSAGFPEFWKSWPDKLRDPPKT